MTNKKLLTGLAALTLSGCAMDGIQGKAKFGIGGYYEQVQLFDEPGIDVFYDRKGFTVNDYDFENKGSRKIRYGPGVFYPICEIQFSYEIDENLRVFHFIDSECDGKIDPDSKFLNFSYTTESSLSNETVNPISDEIVREVANDVLPQMYDELFFTHAQEAWNNKFNKRR